MGRVPKEDPQDKAARLRERRLSEIDQLTAAQKTAGDLTTDFRSVYGMRGLPLQFGSAIGKTSIKKPGGARTRERPESLTLGRGNAP